MRLRHRLVRDRVWLLREVDAHPDSHYSMREQLDLRCIFFHVPKTGGLAVAEALFGNRAVGHINVDTAELIFGRRRFDSFYKFAFVRNPWDRLVSSYNYLRKGGISRKLTPFIREHVLDFGSFEAFVENGLAHEAVLREQHFRPQSAFLCRGNGELAVDYLGRYENLDRDFDEVAARLGASTKLEPRNSSGRTRGYRDCYTDKTRDLTAEIYRRDIDIFGYDY